MLDNAAIHHIDTVVKSFEELGVLVLFLPAYSPDLMPMEECFVKLKSLIKDDEALLDAGEDLETLIYKYYTTGLYQLDATCRILSVTMNTSKMVMFSIYFCPAFV